MADAILFNAGANKVLDAGIAGKCDFALSTRTCDEHKAADTITGGAGKGLGEISGTGYAYASQEAPAAAAQKKSWAQMEWSTGAAVDWPSGVKSVILINGGVAVMAWNLRAGGGARDMSSASTTEKFTPTFSLAQG